MQIELLKTQIAEMQAQMKRAGKDREKDSKEFQVTVADQRASVVSPSRPPRHSSEHHKNPSALHAVMSMSMCHIIRILLRLYVVPSSFIFASEAGDC